jgi:competence protein ComEC
MYFFSSIGGFLLGVLLRSFFVVPTSFVFLLLLFAGTLFVLGHFVIHSKTLRIGAFIFLMITLGVFRFALHTEEPSPLLTSFLNQNVQIEGIIGEEPKQRENGIRLIVGVDTVNELKDTQLTRIVTTAPFGPTYRYGDRVRIEGLLKKPEAFETDTGRIFAYDEYLRKDAVFFSIQSTTVTLANSGEGRWLIEKLFAIKHFLIEGVERVVPEPHASLVGGIVFGVEDALGESLLSVFRRSGLIHIVVLSGFNVAIAADWFMHLAQFLPQQSRSLFGAGGIILFALLTGASATTVRASIMALLVLFARSTARRYSIVRALGVAIFCMVLYNPYILVFDLSFQLSVLATLGLMYLAPLLEEKLTVFPMAFGIRGLTAATLSAQIAVLPILAYKIGELSLVGLPANILALPVIPFAMGIGFATGVLATIATPLAFPFGFITYGLLSYVIFIASFVAGLPGAALVIPPFPVFIVLVFYGILIFIYGKTHNSAPEGALLCVLKMKSLSLDTKQNQNNEQKCRDM